MTRSARGPSGLEVRLWTLGALSGVYLLAFAMVNASRPAPRSVAPPTAAAPPPDRGPPPRREAPAAAAVTPPSVRAPTVRRVVRAAPKRRLRVRTRSS